MTKPIRWNVRQVSFTGCVVIYVFYGLFFFVIEDILYVFHDEIRGSRHITIPMWGLVITILFFPETVSDIFLWVIAGIVEFIGHSLRKLMSKFSFSKTPPPVPPKQGYFKRLFLPYFSGFLLPASLNYYALFRDNFWISLYRILYFQSLNSFFWYELRELRIAFNIRPDILRVTWRRFWRFIQKLWSRFCQFGRDWWSSIVNR